MVSVSFTSHPHSLLIHMSCTQASSLFDPYTFNSFMQVLKRMAAPPTAQQQQPNNHQLTQAVAIQGAAAVGAKHRRGAANSRKKSAAAASSGEDDNDAEDDVDVDMEGAGGGRPRPGRADKTPTGSSVSGGRGGPGACLDCLQDLSAFVRLFPLKEHPEMLALTIETMVDLARCTTVVAGREGGGGAGGARAKVLRLSAAGRKQLGSLFIICTHVVACIFQSGQVPCMFLCTLMVLGAGCTFRRLRSGALHVLVVEGDGTTETFCTRAALLHLAHAFDQGSYIQPDICMLATNGGPPPGVGAVPGTFALD